MKRRRHFVADRAMRSDLIVVSTPSLAFFDRLVEAHEPVCIQALGPEASVEGFDERIVRRLARPREVQGDAVGVGPKIKIARDELGSLVDPDRGWIASPSTNLFERLNDILATVTESRIDDRGIG